MENNQDKINVQDLNRLENDINKFVSELKPNIFVSVKEYFKKLVQVILNQYVLISIASFVWSWLFLEISARVLSRINKLSNPFEAIMQPILLVLFFTFMIAIGFSIIGLIPSISHAVNSLFIVGKKPKNITDLRNKDKIIDFAIRVADNYSADSINIKEKHLNTKISESEAMQNTIILLLPLLVVASLFFFEYITGLSVDDFISTFPKKAKGTFFVVAMTIVLSVAIKSDYVSNIRHEKQALCALQQAQILKQI